LRLALVAPYPDAGRAPVGGVEVATWRLVRALRAAGADATVVAIRGDGDDAAADPPVVRLDVDERGSALRDLRPLRRALARALAELGPALVHAQDLVPAGYAAVRTAAGGAPVVVTAHGNRRQDTLAAYRGVEARLRWLLGRRMARIAARRAAAVVGVHPDPALSVPVRARRYVFAPNIVDDGFFAAKRAPEDGLVLYAGGLRTIKGFDILLAAWPHVLARAPGARLLAPACGAAVAPLPADVAATITTPDWLGGTAYVEALARASALVIPSRFELAPIALAEAWAARVPVVAASVGGIPELARGAARLVAPGDARALADALTDALAGGPAAAALVAAGAERAEAQRAENVAAVHLRLYESILDG